jgi:elongation factor G
MSHLHVDVTLSKMKRIYEVDVVTKRPKIPFKESITTSVDGHHKHKKQTGGRGQYGEVYIRVEPLERGKGFEFEDAITQGKIPSQYIPSVEKGIREVLEKGIIAGYPIADVKVTLYDGSYHEVDSSNESFKIAGSKAFKDAFKQAKPVLLEPIVNMQVFVPARFLGDITGQINSKRGRIVAFESQSGMQVIKAQIPLMEITNYATELSSITAGEGYYTIEFSHYDILPHKLAEGIIAHAKKEEE